MIIRREPVNLVLADNNFTGYLRRAHEAAQVAHARQVAAEATWEPHDWRDSD